MSTYVFIDVSKKQEYIFKNNKLRDNILNSVLIKAITERSKPDILGDIGVSLSGFLDEEKYGKYEFVYSGGGNSIIEFQDESKADDFIEGYSMEVLVEHPDMELYISKVSGNEAEKLSEKEILELLDEKANKAKDSRKSQFRRWSYGVEKIDKIGKPVKRIDFKREKSSKARNYLWNSINESLKGTIIKTTSEMKDYKCADAEWSYIGVISIDGNKMGDMVKKTNGFRERAQLSEKIEEIYFNAVVEQFKELDSDISAEQTDKNKLQPIYITPIVMAGDDICIVMKADHALKVAAGIIKNIHKISGVKKEESEVLLRCMEGAEYLTACAGVSIVKAGYPFFEVVKNAESMCHEAKISIHRIKGIESCASFIDWNITQGSNLGGDIKPGYVKHGGYEEIYHIKPLRIDQKEPVENGIYSFDMAIKMAHRIKKGLEEKREDSKDYISGSTLQGIKKSMYSGKENYNLFFEMKNTDDIDSIADIISDELGMVCRTGLIRDEHTYTYILNDIIDMVECI